MSTDRNLNSSSAASTPPVEAFVAVGETQNPPIAAAAEESPLVDIIRIRERKCRCPPIRKFLTFFSLQLLASSRSGVRRR